ncbi:MAG TPA: hypothetical protein VE572_04290 [Nitrososphaeraceae archaeon]|nr:hypothetical protein [Nitrososphaeraceae archaeon]
MNENEGKVGVRLTRRILRLSSQQQQSSSRPPTTMVVGTTRGYIMRRFQL